MVEYVIEILNDAGEVIAIVHTERDGRQTEMKPTPDNYSHCTKYRVRARAIKAAEKHSKGQKVWTLAHTYGGFVYGTKSSVAPVQSKINRRSNYRSI